MKTYNLIGLLADGTITKATLSKEKQIVSEDAISKLSSEDLDKIRIELPFYFGAESTLISNYLPSGIDSIATYDELLTIWMVESKLRKEVQA